MPHRRLSLVGHHFTNTQGWSQPVLRCWLQLHNKGGSEGSPKMQPDGLVNESDPTRWNLWPLRWKPPGCLSQQSYFINFPNVEADVKLEGGKENTFGAWEKGEDLINVQLGSEPVLRERNLWSMRWRRILQPPRFQPLEKEQKGADSEPSCCYLKTKPKKKKDKKNGKISSQMDYLEEQQMSS